MPLNNIDIKHMLLGFSTGCLYQTHDRLAKATFDVFRNVGCNAIELMWHEDVVDMDSLLAIEPADLLGFEYVSLHAPALDHFTEGEIVEMLTVLTEVHAKIKFDAIIVHPYETMNFDIFRQFDLPFMIENMDWRKDFGKYTESLEGIFAKFDVPMVLDVNHCYTNDPSMHLALELNETFKDRIKEVHLSGFERFHEPLFQTQQEEILDAIPKNLPIIIESVCETEEDVRKEFNYIKEYLREKGKGNQNS